VKHIVKLDRKIMGVPYGERRRRRYITLVIDHYEKGKFKLDEMVTQTYALDEFHTAMHDMHEGKLARGVVTM